MAETLGIWAPRRRFEEGLAGPGWSALEGMFPTGAEPRNARCAIDSFTSIGPGPLAEGLREHSKNAPKLIPEKAGAAVEAKGGSSGSGPSILRMKMQLFRTVPRITRSFLVLTKLRAHAKSSLSLLTGVVRKVVSKISNF